MLSTLRETKLFQNFLTHFDVTLETGKLLFLKPKTALTHSALRVKFESGYFSVTNNGVKNYWNIDIGILICTDDEYFFNPIKDYTIHLSLIKDFFLPYHFSDDLQNDENNLSNVFFHLEMLNCQTKYTRVAEHKKKKAFIVIALHNIISIKELIKIICQNFNNVNLLRYYEDDE